MRAGHDDTSITGVDPVSKCPKQRFCEVRDGFLKNEQQLRLDLAADPRLDCLMRLVKRRRVFWAVQPPIFPTFSLQDGIDDCIKGLACLTHVRTILDPSREELPESAARENFEKSKSRQGPLNQEMQEENKESKQKQLMLDLLQIIDKEGKIDNSRSLAAKLSANHEEMVGVINSMVANELCLIKPM